MALVLSNYKQHQSGLRRRYICPIVVNDIEGTQYVTASLVLPSVYMLIHKVHKGEIVCNWDDSVVQPQQTTRFVLLSLSVRICCSDSDHYNHHFSQPE